MQRYFRQDQGRPAIPAGWRVTRAGLDASRVGCVAPRIRSRGAKRGWGSLGTG